MTTVLLIQSPDPAAPALAADLAAAGFALAGTAERLHLVREALRCTPDVLVCWEPRPEPAFFTALQTLQREHPLPVLVFTQAGDAELMRQALEAGVQGWVVQGYAAQRLRPLVQLARLRHAHEQGLRQSLAELGERFEERKLVDKAKGILMRASRVSEEEAFRLLRTASMHGNQRVGQVSRQVIDAAQMAEAVNRAGQQRMLSQRLVKLYALAAVQRGGAAAAAGGKEAAALLQQSVARVEDNIGTLERTLSQETYGDLLQANREAWQALGALLQQPPQARQLPALDALAETLLQRAETLASALESSGAATTVHVINVSGRQRMLAQRMAKQVLLASGESGGNTHDAVLAATAQAFEQGLAALATAPLSTGEIREILQAAQAAWTELLAAAPQAATPAGRQRLAAASEDLLALFDRLTAAYQHSLQVLMG